MSKKTNRLFLHFDHAWFRGNSLLGSTRLIVLAILVALGSVSGIVQQASAITADDYCSQYKVGGQRNACKDGARGGEECDAYADAYDESVANICRTAKKAKQSGEITDKPVLNINKACDKYTGDLYTACTIGVSYKKCEVQVAEMDVELYNACATGAGIKTIDVPNEIINPPTNTKNDADTYKDAILNACAPYKNNEAAALWCLYGGLGQDGKEGKPKSIQDCLTKSELQGSTTNQRACITGVVSGKTFLGTVDDSGGTDTNTGKNNTNEQNPLEWLDQLDQADSLEKYIDTLHEQGPDADVDTKKVADDKFGFYINGAGKEQKIELLKPGTGNSPVILFFNGGGWIANDKVGQKVAAGFQGSEPVDSRGYAAFDVTYRLGSSGVYYQFEDVMRGVHHMIENAQMYGIDPSRIAVWGDSAGGSLSMRVAGSGKSGARAAVGWSAPTNGYTALFRSFESFLIGMYHSTCIPTDIAGLTNFTDLLTGGSGDVAEYGQGLSSNDLSGLGIDLGGLSFDVGSINPISLLTDVLTAGQYALQTGQNLESISGQLESGGLQSLSGGVMNLSSKKLVECIDNFTAMSPALFASPESAPSFLGGFETDKLIPPDNAFGMRDKLRSLGIRSDALVITGNAEGGNSGFGNHLDFDPRFVCPSLNFLDSVLQPEKGQKDCTSLASLDGPGTPEGLQEFADFLNDIGSAFGGK